MVVGTRKKQVEAPEVAPGLGTLHLGHGEAGEVFVQAPDCQVVVGRAGRLGLRRKCVALVLDCRELALERHELVLELLHTAARLAPSAVLLELGEAVLGVLGALLPPFRGVGHVCVRWETYAVSARRSPS